MTRRSAMTFAAITLGVGGWGAPTMAQTSPSCAPHIEFRGSVPPRLAARLRALVRALPPVASESCHGSRVQVEWTPQQLTLAVALDDGRLASRTLSSIEDVLPTLLAVLAAPEDLPPPEPTAVDSVSVQAVVDDELLPAEPAIVRRLPSVARWGIYTRGELGLTTPVSTGDGLLVGAIEAGVSHGGLRLSLRGIYGVDNDSPRAVMNISGIAMQHPARYTQQTALTLSVTQRAPLGPLAVEVGGIVGASWSTVRDDHGGLLDDAPALRVGVSSALLLPIALGIEVFIRGELSTDIHPQTTSDDTVALAGMLSIGAGWGRSL